MCDEVRVTPKDLVGYETLVYISGDLRGPSAGAADPSYVGTAPWVAVVEWNVVAPENIAYKVTVSDGSLLWAGKVQNNRVTEENWGYGTVFTVQQALGVAARFILNSPTFKFDGITDTLSVTDIKTLESLPVQYVITLTFESRHAGYGDREGQALAQVITPHRAVVTVVKGSVTSAILDDQWDELSQKPIQLAS